MTALIVFECRPVDAAWALGVPGNCINMNVALVVMAGFNVLTDFITLGLPLPRLWQLQTSRTRKLQLMGIFLLGGL